MKMGAETAVIQSQAKKSWGYQKLEKARKILSLQKDHGPDDSLILDLDPPEL